MTMTGYCHIVIGVFMGLELLEKEAFAYLDPGATSFLIQIISAGIVTAAFFARRFLRKIFLFFFFPNRARHDERIKK